MMAVGWFRALPAVIHARRVRAAGAASWLVAWHVGRGEGGDLLTGGAEDDQPRAGAVGERLRPGEVRFLPGPGPGVGGGDVMAGLITLGRHQTGGLAAHRDHGQRHRAHPD